MNKELVISHKLDINSNMEDLAIQIKNDIAEKYDVVVTDDSLPETKKMMAAINKEKTEFKSTYKAFKDKVLEPLAPLDEKAKEIEKFFDDARAALESQVKKFEAGKLERAKEVCIEYAMAQCEEKGIDFAAVTISDLFTKLGSVTATGNISGTAKGEIDNRIQAIENAVLKARLEAEEKAKRDREIAEAARLEAEKKAKEREIELLAKAEREKQEALLRAEREKADAINQAKQEAREEVRQEAPRVIDTTPFDEPKPVVKVQPEPVITDDGKRVYKITFEFEIRTDANNPVDKVLEKVKAMMLSEAGIKNLKNTEIK